MHSGVALAMAKAAKDNNTLLVIPNAGADAITGPMCGANIVRSSFSNWQPGYAMGVVAGQKGVKRAMTITWNYAAGAESTKGFTEGLEKGGGKVVKDLTLPFPNVEFQALLTEIAAQKPDAVYAFFAGGGAVKFVKDYAAAGLNKTIPLYGPGFLTDGTLEAQGASAQNMLTTLHYADNLDTPKNNAFRKAYAIAYKAQPDVYAVQGYDAAQILANGLKAVGGDLSKRDALTAAMRKTPVDSPRGKFTLSAARQPGAGHLPARGRGQQQRVPLGRGEGARRSGARLQALSGAAAERGDAPRHVRPPRPLERGDGHRHLPRPVPERRPVRPAAVPRRQRPDADLRDHGRHQPGARQLLHARRVPRVRARAVVRRLVRDRGSSSASCWPALFGYVLEWVFFSFLYERDHLQQVLLTYALILVFEELRSLAVRQRRARRAGAGVARPAASASAT